MIVRPNNDKIDNIDDNNNAIMSIATIPPANNLKPLVPPDTSDGDNTNNNDKESSNNNVTSDKDSLHKGNLETQGVLVADNPEEDLTEGQDQGVCQSKCKNKGRTVKYKDHSFIPVRHS